MKKSSSKKYMVFAMSVAFLVVPFQQSFAQGVVVVDPTPAINAQTAQQWMVHLKEFAQTLKGYENDIMKYKELVSQGITQAKQYKNDVEQLMEMYHQGKTFVTEDLPHFISDMKADPIGTLNGYSGKLISLAQNADQALGALKEVKINVGNGTCYSLDELAGLSAASWYDKINGQTPSDGKMDEDAKAYAAKLSFKDKAYIQNKFHISAEDYYKWCQKSNAFKKSCASALASCTQWTQDAQKNAKAVAGYATKISQMGMTKDISANEIGQMTNQLLLSVVQTLQPAITSLQQSQATGVQSYAIAQQEAQNKQNKENAVQAAWKQELERDEAKFGEDIGEPLYPSAPKNRGYPNMWGKSE